MAIFTEKMKIYGSKNQQVHQTFFNRVTQPNLRYLKLRSLTPNAIMYFDSLLFELIYYRLGLKWRCYMNISPHYLPLKREKMWEAGPRSRSLLNCWTRMRSTTVSHLRTHFKIKLLASSMFFCATQFFLSSAYKE